MSVGGPNIARNADSDQIESKTNTSSPVSIQVLSFDILISIFFFIRDASLESSVPLGSSETSKGWDWLAITKTCKLWRDLAIERPHLWTHVFTSFPLRKLRTFLERSSPFELNVYLDGINTRKDAKAATALLKDHMWRARVLKGITNDFGIDKVKALLLGLSECCKTVDLKYNHVRVMFVDVEDLNPKIQLETLSLNMVLFPWSSSLFHGLSELSISSERTPIRKPIISELQNILEHCPNLRILKLDYVYPSMAGYEEIREIQLQHLERVIVDHALFPTMPFYFSSFPSTVKLDMTFDGYLINVPHPWSMPQEIPNKRNTCTTLCIDISDEHFSIRSNPVRDRTSVSYDFAFSINMHYPSQESEYISNAIRTLLRDPFWATADRVFITFRDFDPRSVKSCMDSSSWGTLLDGLPRFSKMLSIKIPFQIYKEKKVVVLRAFGKPIEEGHYTIFGGLSEALSEVTGESNVRLPELERLAIVYEHLKEEDAVQCYELLLGAMEKRTVHTKWTCTVDFEENVDAFIHL